VIPGHEYADFDGLGLAHLVCQRELTPMELVDAAIARVEELNPRLNAVIFSAYDQARQRAKMNLTGLLAGVPILLKDILGHKQGWPTRQGAGFLPATGSMHDSTLSQTIRDCRLACPRENECSGIRFVADYGILALRAGACVADGSGATSGE